MKRSQISNNRNIRYKYVIEPATSITSLKFIHDDEEDEKDSDRVHETPIPEDTYTRSVKKYELMHVIMVLLTGDPTATSTQLTLLYEMELDNKFVQDVFRENRGIDLLINILEVKQSSCHLGALKVIEKIASNNKVRLLFANLGIMPAIVALIRTGDIDVKMYASKALSQLCQVQKSARFFRKAGGIPLLVNCLDIDESILNTTYNLLTERQKDILTLTVVATSTLKQLSQYPKTIKNIYNHGISLVMKKIANSCHKNLLKEYFGLLSLCSDEAIFRNAIEREGVLVPLIQNLTDEDQELREKCASTIATCASDSALTRHMVRMLNGLNDVVDLTKDMKQQDQTLVALTGAAAKLAQDDRNLKIMTDKGLTSNLMKYLKLGICEEIISNVLEGLAECARLENNAHAILNVGLLPTIIQRLRENNSRMLTAAARCLGACALHKDVAQNITKYDGMRLLFSTIKNNNPSVVATALWALKPLIQNTVESAEEIRCLMVGLSLLIPALDFPDVYVRGKTCGLVAEISKDPENLQILSDMGVVHALAECAREDNEEIRADVAEAIANTSVLEKNAREFGMLGVVVVMRQYLQTSNTVLHTQAMRALFSLTMVSYNCVILHECGGVSAVLTDTLSPLPELHELATKVLRNMRQVGVELEKKLISQCRFVSFSEQSREKRKLVQTKTTY